MTKVEGVRLSYWYVSRDINNRGLFSGYLLTFEQFMLRKLYFTGSINNCNNLIQYKFMCVLLDNLYPIGQFVFCGSNAFTQ
jgi:hypothetical protein